MEDVTVAWVAVILHWMSIGFIILIGFLIMVILEIFIKDRLQTEHAIRHNYPVIARFRYLFEYLGKFMRQYMFAADQDEWPFNRAQRTWVYRASKNLSTTQSFGSTRNLSHPGKVLFINCAFPMLEKDAVSSPLMVIGANTKTPFI